MKLDPETSLFDDRTPLEATLGCNIPTPRWWPRAAAIIEATGFLIVVVSAMCAAAAFACSAY